MAIEQRTPPPPAYRLSSALKDGRCCLAAGVWCTTLIGSNGFIFWLPQIVKDLSSDLSPIAIGLVSAVPWVGLALGMWFNSQHSDATQERYWHVGVPLAVCALALVGASSLPPGWVSLALMFVSGIGLGAAQGVFWSIPTTFLHRTAAAAGITLINLVGNIGSLTGPVAIGWIRTHSEAFTAPIWFIAGVMVIGTALLVTLHGRRA
jgi:ACS family tartrate transporter-like MFS transporter